MDESETELLRLIYTRIGMIMEDASINALELGGPRSTFNAGKIATLERSIRKLSALYQAAKAMRE